MALTGTMKRIAAIGALGACSAVAAFATIAPGGEAVQAPQAAPIVEALPLKVRELATPAQFIREDQFQRGDTLAGFLQRLGIDDGEIKPIPRMPALRGLRTGTTVRAEVSADGLPSSISFLTGRDTLLR